MRRIDRVEAEDESKSILGGGSRFPNNLPIIPTGECIAPVCRQPPSMRGIGGIESRDQGNSSPVGE
jgi:hypothetical protein